MQINSKIETLELEQVRNCFSRLPLRYKSSTLINMVIGIGIFLRLFHFFYNRSFWTDEVYLNNSLIQLNFIELLGPLEYEQKAPIGFLWVVKLFVLTFGKGEMALRLFPLLCGIASLFIFKKIVNYYFKLSSIIVAMAILAVSPPLVYYAVEAKQYSTDLLATIVALFLYIRYHQKSDILSLLLWGIWGAILIWFSFSVIFILAGMALGICLYYLVNKNWKLLLYSILPFSIWLVSFAVNYFLFIQQYADSEWLVFWFRDVKSFMPLPPTSVKDLTWFITMPLSMLHFALGLSWFDLNYNYSNTLRAIARMPLLPLLCWIVGLVVIFRRDKKLFWIVTLPFLLAMLASGLEMYPLFERLFVFLAPLLILFIIFGYEHIMALLPDSKWRYILPALLIMGAIGNSADTLLKPSMFGKHFKNVTGRQALLYINNRVQPGDAIYVYWNFNHFYKYYKAAYNLNYVAMEGSDLKSVSNNPADYLENLSVDFASFNGKKRVWLVYRNFGKLNIGDFKGQPAWYHDENFHPGEMITAHLNTIGKVIDIYQTPDMTVALFDITSQ